MKIFFSNISAILINILGLVFCVIANDKYAPWVCVSVLFLYMFRKQSFNKEDLRDYDFYLWAFTYLISFALLYYCENKLFDIYLYDNISMKTITFFINFNISTSISLMLLKLFKIKTIKEKEAEE